jgi:2-polyprenyl-3-methyl-5-hydroxy-6-metoxy-1,4-benzoquinol methylase
LPAGLAYERVRAGLRYAVDQAPVGRRKDLLERTPRKSTVLDIGCWSGYNGRFLIAERDAVVDGVEPEAQVGRLAREDYRCIIELPIEEAAPMLVAAGIRYDVVLLFDVLEHLVDPSTVLRGARDLIRAGGRALVSLPNVAHWSVRAELLTGRWRYRDSGLLDRTHLRFFTQESAERLIAEAGWVVHWRGWSMGQLPLVRLSEPALQRLERWHGLFSVQMLFDISPAA